MTWKNAHGGITYQNRLYASFPLAMFDFLQHVLIDECAWVLHDSDDGSAAPGARGAPVVSGSSGAGGLNNANAYMVLEEPAGGKGRQICVVFSASGVLNSNCKILQSEDGSYALPAVWPAGPGTADDEVGILGRSVAYADCLPWGTASFYLHCAGQDAAGGTMADWWDWWLECTIVGTGTCGFRAFSYGIVSASPSVPGVSGNESPGAFFAQVNGQDFNNMSRMSSSMVSTRVLSRAGTPASGEWCRAVLQYNYSGDAGAMEPNPGIVGSDPHGGCHLRGIDVFAKGAINLGPIGVLERVRWVPNVTTHSYPKTVKDDVTSEIYLCAAGYGGAYGGLAHPGWYDAAVDPLV